VLIDLRNIYRPEEVARHDFVYDCVGRPPDLPDGTEIKIAARAVAGASRL
jgi:hypothetical protein